MLSKNEKIMATALTPGKIIDTVSRHFKVSFEAICDSSRKAQLVYARQVLIFLLRKDLGLPLEAIGELVGGRDHSTVIHSIEKIEGLARANQETSDDISRIRTLISSN